MKKIICFASGNGSNVKAIFNYIVEKKLDIKIAGIVCNKKNAGIIPWVNENNIPLFIINNDFETEEINIKIWNKSIFENIDLIVLAGFLRKIPEDMISIFRNKIINIHPSLLPKYGGEGMYGNKVHQKVLENKETQSGISIHFVNNEYDKGEIITQATCTIDEQETLETLLKKIHQLEHENFPKTIEKLLLK